MRVNVCEEGEVVESGGWHACTEEDDDEKRNINAMHTYLSLLDCFLYTMLFSFVTLESYKHDRYHTLL
jgi:hypothetical protein